jgi:hypothetical protein
MTLTASSSLLAVLILAAIGVLISSAEYLWQMRLFAPDGLLSWKVCALTTRHTAGAKVGRVLGILFRPSGLTLLLALRALAALVVLMEASVWRRTEVWAIGVVLACCVLLNVRHHFGRDGSDQMTVLIFGGMWLALVVPTHPGVLALWFVALQSTLSYCVAGFAKIGSRVWWNGDAIVGILGTRAYGLPEALRAPVMGWLPWVARPLCWSVMMFECTFWLVWFLPPPAALALLGVGVLFHVGTAVLMGLNTFLWAFTATYPALWFLTQNWHRGAW